VRITVFVTAEGLESPANEVCARQSRDTWIPCRAVTVWSAFRVFFGRYAIVRFFVAARCAFWTFRFAASSCLPVAMAIAYPLGFEPSTAPGYTAKLGGTGSVQFESPMSTSATASRQGPRTGMDER